MHFLRSIFWAHEKFSNFRYLKVTRFSQNPPIPLLHRTDIHTQIIFFCWRFGICCVFYAKRSTVWCVSWMNWCKNWVILTSASTLWLPSAAVLLTCAQLSSPRGRHLPLANTSRRRTTTNGNTCCRYLPSWQRICKYSCLFVMNHLHSFDSRSQNDVMLYRICIAQIQPQYDLYSFCLTIQPTPHWIWPHSRKQQHITGLLPPVFSLFAQPYFGLAQLAF